MVDCYNSNQNGRLHSQSINAKRNEKWYNLYMDTSAWEVKYSGSTMNWQDYPRFARFKPSSIFKISLNSFSLFIFLIKEIYQLGIDFQTICITYSVGVSCLLMIATTFLYPSKYVLQTIVDSETQGNTRPGDTESNEEISTRIIRSQDLSASFMSSYKMYREAVNKYVFITKL